MSSRANRSRTWSKNRHLIDVLVARAEAEGIEASRHRGGELHSRSQGIDVALADGSVMAASLLVAADGARSKLRERAGIATHGWDYDQSGIVVTVGHERDHHGRAKNIFCPQVVRDPAADRTTLVAGMDEKRAEAARIVALSEEEFHGETRTAVWAASRRDQDARQAARVSARLFRGALVHRGTAGAGRRRRACDPPDRRTGAQHGPEGCRGTRRGDRRRRAARHGTLGRPNVLDRYQRWRALRHHGDGLATNSLNLLFSNESTLLRTVRDIGLGLVDRAPPLKSMFIRQAAGLAGEVPRLLKGEAL